MIDIHNHLLYGIDDGSKSINDSIEVLRDLEHNGYTDIILTPHYITSSDYNSNRNKNLQLLELLKRNLKENDISLNLYLGNEIFIDDNIEELIKHGLISTLNNTNYLLIELPMSGEYKGYQELFKYLLDKGYKVVLAHPERYLSFQEDYDKVLELHHMGIYFQSNIDSFVGKYGPEAEKLVVKLLKDNLISFLATDIHRKKSDYGKWDKAKSIVLKYVTEDVYDVLTRVNPGMLIA